MNTLAGTEFNQSLADSSLLETMTSLLTSIFHVSHRRSEFSTTGIKSSPT